MCSVSVCLLVSYKRRDRSRWGKTTGGLLCIFSPAWGRGASIPGLPQRVSARRSTVRHWRPEWKQDTSSSWTRFRKAPLVWMPIPLSKEPHRLINESVTAEHLMNIYCVWCLSLGSSHPQLQSPVALLKTGFPSLSGSGERERRNLSGQWLKSLLLTGPKMIGGTRTFIG